MRESVHVKSGYLHMNMKRDDVMCVFGAVHIDS